MLSTMMAQPVTAPAPMSSSVSCAPASSSAPAVAAAAAAAAAVPADDGRINAASEQPHHHQHRHHHQQQHHQQIPVDLLGSHHDPLTRFIRSLSRSGFITLVYILPSLTAVFVATSRVTDYWHHVDDVVAGSLLGVASAIGAWTYVREKFILND